MPSPAHRNVRTILCLTALPIALVACQRADTGAETGAETETGTEATASPVVQAQAVKSMPTPASSHADVAHWQCANLLVDSQLDDGVMQLHFSGQSLALQQMASPSGMRYADSAGNAFAREGDDASLTLAGDRQYECTRSQRASPWILATARGITFRAVGNEPGWLVEIGAGDAPSLHASLDYGQRDVDVTQMHPDARGFEGKTPGGTTVTLQIVRNACQDGMSGESFEAEATLVIDDTSYRGCGAFLLE